jgi:hypothetical protein
MLHTQFYIYLTWVKLFTDNQRFKVSHINFYNDKFTVLICSTLENCCFCISIVIEIFMLRDCFYHGKYGMLWR